MKWLSLLFLPFAALAQQTAVIDDRFPSPDRQFVATYRVDETQAASGEQQHTGTVEKGGKRLWSLSAKGRAMLFDWAPDSRHLLVGVVNEGRGMSLYLLDAAMPQPAEKNLDLDEIARHMTGKLPSRQTASLTFRSLVDFEHIVWLGQNRCRLPYVFRAGDKAGDAVLMLDVTAKKPRLKISSITPLAEQEEKRVGVR